MSTGIFPIARSNNCDNDWSRTVAAAAVGTAGILLKGAPGRLARMRAENISATQYWLMVFSKATAPVNNDVPIYRHRLNANSGESIDLTGVGGIYGALGLGIAISSTSGVLTLAVAADLLYEAHWK